MQNPNLYILTGGPGAGKTTILAELENRGFRTVPEIARQLIQEQVQADGNALPWGDKKRYAKLMLERSIISFREHTPASQIVFCDRAIPDTLCYLRLIGQDDTEAMAACSSYRYARTVFLASPCRSVCGETRLPIPAAFAASFTAIQATLVVTARRLASCSPYLGTGKSSASSSASTCAGSQAAWH